LNVLVTADLIKQLIMIVKDAGTEIMKVYATDFNIQIKDDKSPVTLADKNANSIIEKGLNDIDSSLPILSEEGKNFSYETRKDWEYYWLVDPLDGTKDFIKKNGEFTVNIALIKNATPIFGMVYAPLSECYFWGGEEYGAWRKDDEKENQRIHVNSLLEKKIKLASSRSHPSEKMEKFLLQFGDYELYPMGSSFKICLVSDGTVDLYPRLGPTMEWDTAASHAVIKGAGGDLLQVSNKLPLVYNKSNLLNPEFIAGNVDVIHALKL
jgi:3'(2'), 5'-bisphosphate nucleotidase